MTDANREKLLNEWAPVVRPYPISTQMQLLTWVENVMELKYTVQTAALNATASIMNGVYGDEDSVEVKAIKEDIDAIAEISKVIDLHLNISKAHLSSGHIAKFIVEMNHFTDLGPAFQTISRKTQKDMDRALEAQYE